MAELRAYEPTWRDRLARVLMGDGRASPERRAIVEGLTGSSGLGTTGMGLVDVTPAGVPLAAQEAAQGGDYRGAAMAIVPPIAASRLGFAANAGKNQMLRQAAGNTPGASFVDDVLHMNVTRHQLPEQAGEMSTRGGVFYLPESSPYARYYKKGGTAGNWYGGGETVAGETALYNPLFVKGQTGGKAPEAAYAELFSKKELADLQKQALDASIASKNYGIKEQLVDRFLGDRAPELQPWAHQIMENSAKGNQLRYALQEAAIGSAVRGKGYDSVLGYSTKRDKSPFITELFDVRENRYPGPNDSYSVWDGLFGLGGK